MKKFRNLLYNSFFTQIANIGIIIVFSLIIAVQIYKLNSVWIHNNFLWLYNFIKSNDVVIRIILTLIPLFFSLFLGITQYITHE